MEYFGLIVEIVLLGVGIYIYLFAIGKIQIGEEEKNSKAEAFRQENGRLLRLLSLALMAIMIVNLVAHVRQLMAG